MLQRLRFNLAYYQKPVWDTGVSPRELMDFIAAHTPGRALDLGCGTGTNAITLAKSGWQVMAVDYAQRAIRTAKRKAQQSGLTVDFHVEDVTRFKTITGRFDLILDMGCFHSLSTNSRAKYITNIDRFLAPNGTYLLYAFFKNQAGSLGPGITKGDVNALVQKLVLLQRTDSTERGIRPSAWFSFTKRA